MAGASALDTMGRSRISAPGPTVQPDDSLSCSPCLVLLLLCESNVPFAIHRNENAMANRGSRPTRTMAVGLVSKILNSKVSPCISFKFITKMVGLGLFSNQAR